MYYTISVMLSRANCVVGRLKTVCVCVREKLDCRPTLFFFQFTLHINIIRTAIAIMNTSDVRRRRTTLGFAAVYSQYVLYRGILRRKFRFSAVLKKSIHLYIRRLYNV